MKKISAKFNSTCAKTGKKIKKGEEMYYDYGTKKCYSIGSITPDEKQSVEENSVAQMVQANEDAYFDNFCQSNNI